MVVICEAGGEGLSALVNIPAWAACPEENREGELRTISAFVNWG